MPYILIDTNTGHMSAFDADGEPIAERKHIPVALYERKDWLMDILSLCYATGIERLEFLRGGSIEVVSARDFFQKVFQS